MSCLSKNLLSVLLVTGALLMGACAKPCTQCLDVSGKYDVTSSKECGPSTGQGKQASVFDVQQSKNSISIGIGGDAIYWSGTLLDDGGIELEGATLGKGGGRSKITGTFSDGTGLTFEGEYEDSSCITEMRWTRR